MLSESFELDALLKEFGNGHSDTHLTNVEWTATLFDPIFPEDLEGEEGSFIYPSEQGYESSGGSAQGATSDAFDEILSSDSRSDSPAPIAWTPTSSEAMVLPMSGGSALMSHSSERVAEAEGNEERPTRSGGIHGKRRRASVSFSKTKQGKLSRPCTCAHPALLDQILISAASAACTLLFVPVPDYWTHSLDCSCSARYLLPTSLQAAAWQRCAATETGLALAAFALAPSAQRRNRCRAAAHRVQGWRSARGWRRWRRRRPIIQIRRRRSPPWRRRRRRRRRRSWRLVRELSWCLTCVANLHLIRCLVELSWRRVCVHVAVLPYPAQPVCARCVRITCACVWCPSIT